MPAIERLDLFLTGAPRPDEAKRPAEPVRRVGDEDAVIHCGVEERTQRRVNQAHRIQRAPSLELRGEEGLDAPPLKLATFGVPEDRKDVDAEALFVAPHSGHLER